jgi:hypothetical protein
VKRAVTIPSHLVPLLPLPLLLLLLLLLSFTPLSVANPGIRMKDNLNRHDL